MPESDDVPPAVLCATCSRAQCAGCTAAAPERAGIAWEARQGGVWRRLWQSALACSVDPVSVLGSLPSGSLVAAFSFALLAELVALGSFALCALPCTWCVAPRLALRIATNPVALLYCASTWLAASVTMVALHALWGVCLELGGRSREVDGFKRSLRFALYACGWDLLTSPAGVIAAFATRVTANANHPVLDAIRAPRPALGAYLREQRRFSLEARRRGTRLSVAVLGACMLVLFALLGLGALRLAEWAWQV